MKILENVYIWGGGLIGYTLAQAFADQQKGSTVLDVDSAVIENIQSGRLPRAELRELMDSPTLLHRDLIKGCHISNFQPQDGPSIHFLSVPTEKNGETLYAPIESTILNIAKKSNKDYPVYIIAESTISPNWFSNMHATFVDNGWVHGKNYHIGASPRRDVFNSKNLRMQHISKIIGGDSPEIVHLMKVIYKDIAGEVYAAKDAKHAMLVKVVENFLRDSTLHIVNGLASVFPDYDMVDVFELASTKWNIEKYHPSLGIGGYCIPLAKKYMADAAGSADQLERIVQINSNGQSMVNALESVIKRNMANSVAILGLSYGPSFKVHTFSPTFGIIEHLKACVDSIAIHDPFYSSDEIKELTGCESLDDISDLKSYDAVIIVTPHPYYHEKKEVILNILEKSGALLIDNLGSFKGFIHDNINYWEVGSLIMERKKSCVE